MAENIIIPNLLKKYGIKKSYVVTVMGVVAAVGALLTGQANFVEFFTLITAALGIGTIRHGIETSSSTVIDEVEQDVDEAISTRPLP